MRPPPSLPAEANAYTFDSCPPTLLGNGDFCTASCKPLYTGSYKATCNDGSINVTGSCTPVPCTSTPVGPFGQHVAPFANCATPAAYGATCTTGCTAGYTGGYNATCSFGTWNMTGSCNPAPCTSPPNTPDPNTSGFGNCPTPLEHGGNCSTQCSPQWTGVGVSSGYTAVCSYGAWNVSGTCHAPCTTQPASETNAIAYNCPLPVLTNATCTTSCNTGYSGTPTALCWDGSYSTYAGAQYKCSPDPCAGKTNCYQTLLPNITVSSTCYIPFLVQFSGGGAANSFNAFYGTGTPLPTLLLDTAAKAGTAVTQINKRLTDDPSLDAFPAPDGATATNGFRVPYSWSTNTYSHQFGHLASGAWKAGGSAATGISRTAASTYTTLAVLYPC